METSTTPRRPRPTRGRVGALGAIVLLLGVLFIGAAWAIFSDRDAKNELTENRIATIEANQTPDFPAGVIPPTIETSSSPTATTETESGEPPLIAAVQPTPTRPLATATAGATPETTPTPIPDMPPPTHIRIPALGIDTDVVQVSSYPVETQGVTVLQWNVADWAAGHHDTSADPGEGGNVVMSGHDDYKGEVFRGLHDAEIGDEVFVTSPAGVFYYRITEIYLRKEKGEPLSERLNIGQFLMPMPEERLTLITCWPYGVDDHRMIIVAKPAQGDDSRYRP